MKNRRQTATPAGKGPGAKAFVVHAQLLSPLLRDALARIPCVRREKVSDTQRLMASAHWPPRCDLIADRILFEHLMDPLET